MKRLFFFMAMLPIAASAQSGYDRIERYADAQFRVMAFVQDHPFITLAILATIFIIKVFVVRAIFDINSMQQQLKAQSKLLALLAEKQGVSQTDIDKAMPEERPSSNALDVDIS